MQYDKFIRESVEEVSKLIELSRRLKKEAEIIDCILQGVYAIEISFSDVLYFAEKGYVIDSDEFTRTASISL